MTTVVGAAAGAVKPEAEGIFRKLLGPAAEQLGGYLELRAYLLRRDWTEKLLEGAHKKATAAGRSIESVPLKLLQPILQGAGLEDDESLSEKWANLLSNAATDARYVEVRFADILRQLTPEAAAILQTLAVPNGCVSPPGTVLDEKLAAARPMSFMREHATYWMDQVVSLGLCRPRDRIVRTFPVPGTSDDVGLGVTSNVVLSDLGARFLAAVQPPRPVRLPNAIWTGVIRQDDAIEMRARVVVGDNALVWHGVGESYSPWGPTLYTTNVGSLLIHERSLCYPYEFEFRGMGDPLGPLLERIQQLRHSGGIENG